MKAAARSVAFVLAALAASAGAAEPRAVAFKSLDGTALDAWLFEAPQQPAKGTVVALHGCGGLYATGGSRRGQLNARHQAMADLLVGEGYNVVYPDSLRPRGETSICTQRIGSRRITQSERRADALGTLAWVAAQPWARADRIALLGWSHGGSAVLSATDGTRRDVKEQAAHFATAIAFYPGCSAALKSGYKPDTRLTIMIGELDDWTPAPPCVELAKAVDAEINLYPDSYHDFDNPIGQVTLRRDVPNGLHPGQGVHAGRNPAAREQAYARLRSLLAETFAR